jgi:hypothetical protein
MWEDLKDTKRQPNIPEDLKDTPRDTVQRPKGLELQGYSFFDTLEETISALYDSGAVFLKMCQSNFYFKMLLKWSWWDKPVLRMRTIQESWTIRAQLLRVLRFVILILLQTSVKSCVA